MGSKITIRFTAKQSRDFADLAAERGMRPAVFARRQLALGDIEDLPSWVLPDLSRGCVGSACRRLATCTRCLRQRYMGRGSGICFDCATRSSESCAEQVHDRLASQLGPADAHCWCAACGAALRTPQADAPTCAPSRYTERVQVRAARGEGPPILIPATGSDAETAVPVKPPASGSFVPYADRPFDCGNDQESFLDDYYYVAIIVNRDEAAVVERLAALQGVTPEAFLRRQLGLFRFDSLPDWMHADAAQGCVSCASWRDCPRCSERGLLGGGAAHCANCAASGVDPCNSEVHAAFAESIAIVVEGAGEPYRCTICGAAFGDKVVGRRASQARGRAAAADREPTALTTPAGSGDSSERVLSTRGANGPPPALRTEPARIAIPLSFDEHYAVRQLLRRLWQSDHWTKAAAVTYGYRSSGEFCLFGESADLAALASVMQQAVAADDAAASSPKGNAMEAMLLGFGLKSALKKIRRGLDGSDEA